MDELVDAFATTYVESHEYWHKVPAEEIAKVVTELEPEFVHAFNDVIRIMDFCAGITLKTKFWD